MCKFGIALEILFSLKIFNTHISASLNALLNLTFNDYLGLNTYSKTCLIVIWYEIHTVWWLKDWICWSNKGQGREEILNQLPLCLSPGWAGAESRLLSFQEFCELVVKPLVASHWPWSGVFTPEQSASAEKLGRFPPRELVSQHITVDSESPSIVFDLKVKREKILSLFNTQKTKS